MKAPLRLISAVGFSLLLVLFFTVSPNAPSLINSQQENSVVDVIRRSKPFFTTTTSSRLRERWVILADEKQTSWLEKESSDLSKQKDREPVDIAEKVIAEHSATSNTPYTVVFNKVPRYKANSFLREEDVLFGFASSSEIIYAYTSENDDPRFLAIEGFRGKKSDVVILLAESDPVDPVVLARYVKEQFGVRAIVMSAPEEDINVRTFHLINAFSSLAGMSNGQYLFATILDNESFFLDLNSYIAQLEESGVNPIESHYLGASSEAAPEMVGAKYALQTAGITLSIPMHQKLAKLFPDCLAMRHEKEGQGLSGDHFIADCVKLAQMRRGTESDPRMVTLHGSFPYNFSGDVSGLLQSGLKILNYHHVGHSTLPADISQDTLNATMDLFKLDKVHVPLGLIKKAAHLLRDANFLNRFTHLPKIQTDRPTSYYVMANGYSIQSYPTPIEGGFNKIERTFQLPRTTSPIFGEMRRAQRENVEKFTYYLSSIEEHTVHDHKVVSAVYSRVDLDAMRKVRYVREAIEVDWIV